MRDLRQRLHDIIEAISRIEAEQAKGKTGFDASPLVQTWMVHHLMIIGEAVRSIDPVAPDRWHEEYSCPRLFSYQSGDRLGTVEKHVPVLKHQVQEVLASLPPE